MLKTMKGCEKKKGEKVTKDTIKGRIITEEKYNETLSSYKMR